jgi:hypothetical protein
MNQITLIMLTFTNYINHIIDEISKEKDNLLKTIAKQKRLELEEFRAMKKKISKSTALLLYGIKIPLLKGCD